MIKRIPILCVCLCFLLSASISKIWGMEKSITSDIVYVVPIHGEIDPSLAAFLKRALREIAISTGEDKNSLIIIEIDTFGGRVDSALSIVDSITSESRNTTVAYVKTKAISAGALIALACDRLYMRKNTTIGDCAPIIYSNDGPKELGEKFQSPLRAQFRSLAKKNGYSEVLAESMVSIEMEIYEVVINGQKIYMESHEIDELSVDDKEKITSKKLIVGKNELLTMDDSEAVELGFSLKSTENSDEIIGLILDGKYSVRRIEESWSENLAGFIGKISPFLLLIGLGSLYIELKIPGFGIAGFIGITCLLLVFFNQYLVGLANYTELIFLVGGFILLGFEVFVIPGFGIAGFSGIILVATGMILSFQDFIIPNPSLPWQSALLQKNIMIVLGSLISGFILTLLFFRFIFIHISRFIKGPYLDVTLKDVSCVETGLAHLKVGDIGIALTFLRPSGKMIIGNEIYDVITRGEYAERESRLKVEEIRKNRIIVSREG